jgi:hypothetical protein
MDIIGKLEARARECEGLARSAAPRDRAVWVRMAERWRLLALHHTSAAQRVRETRRERVITMRRHAPSRQPEAAL